MQRLWISLSILAVLAGVLPDDRFDQTSIYYTVPVNESEANSSWNNGGLFEEHGGRIIRNQKVFERSKSPYLLREDLFIEKDAKLIIESGVEIRFSPMIGITVRGIIIAKHKDVLRNPMKVSYELSNEHLTLCPTFHRTWKLIIQRCSKDIYP
ncbi:hypothetical protein G5I_02078 [Acromyrmex echinatior]|uniref:Uncharacterized protein n=1 Tax=Acromyrmex echinatior TaxID=103372 RepID=F4W9C9_ACREC|nr:hypothetical protein G5I_02078 [Acromyrmex echinatior]